MLLLPGDLSYADGQQPLWDTFGRLVEPLASHRPWMVTQGNHEIEQILILEPHAFKSYNARWRMPFDESGSTSNLYYSFDVSGVHVVMLGSYTDLVLAQRSTIGFKLTYLRWIGRAHHGWLFSSMPHGTILMKPIKGKVRA